MKRKIRNTWKRFKISLIRGRQETAMFKIAEMASYKYPPNTSLHEIVRDLKKS